MKREHQADATDDESPKKVLGIEIPTTGLAGRYVRLIDYARREKTWYRSLNKDDRRDISKAARGGRRARNPSNAGGVRRYARFQILALRTQVVIFSVASIISLILDQFPNSIGWLGTPGSRLIVLVAIAIIMALWYLVSVPRLKRAIAENADSQ
jgi:hypothetical protein